MRSPSNLPFNKTLYAVSKNNLVAFKVLICSYVCNNGEYNWKYYVKTPFGTKWYDTDLGTYNQTLFNSKEEYFSFLETGEGGFCIKTEHYYLYNSIHIIWKWDGEQAVKRIPSIRNIILNENGLSLIYEKRDDEFWTKEECVKANLETMEIFDFPEEEDTISITINLPINNKKIEPIVRTLKFIEE